MSHGLLLYVLALAGLVIVALVIALVMAETGHDEAGKVIAIAAAAVGAIAGLGPVVARHGSESSE